MTYWSNFAKTGYVLFYFNEIVYEYDKTYELTHKMLSKI